MNRFSARLGADRAVIGAAYLNGTDPGLVSRIRLACGDAHCGGESVARVDFETGLVLAYKPRSVGLLAAWGRLIKRLYGIARTGTPLLPTVIERSGYGWVNWIESSPCDGPEQVREYYRRAGFLLAAAYVIGASDLHAENVIASGASPVVIDGETLLMISWSRPPSVDAIRARAFNGITPDGVVRTGLLPRWQSTGAGVTDASGLQGMGGQNLPHLGAMVQRPSAFVEELSTGFEAGYETIRSPAGCGAICAFLEETAGVECRAVLRPTSVYNVLLRHEVARRAGRVSPSARAARSEACEAVWARLAEAERASLRALEIPRITVGALATAASPTIQSPALVQSEDSPVAEIRRSTRLAPGMYDAARSREKYAEGRLRAMGRADFEQQVALIRASLALRAAKKEAPVPVPVHGGGNTSRHAPMSTSPEITLARDRLAVSARIRSAPVRAGELISAAESIGEEFVSGALSEGTDLFWLSKRPTRHPDRWQLVPSDFGLYDGSTGIALFIAALFRMTGDRRWYHAARGAAAPVLRALGYAGHGPDVVQRFGVGGAEGLGGIAFGACLLTLFLDAPVYAEAAATAILRVPADRSASRSELLYGDAGLILGATAVLSVTGEPRLASWIAEAAGKYATALSGLPAVHSDAAPAERRARETDGMAHGTAGLAAALGCGWSHTRDIRAGRAACALIPRLARQRSYGEPLAARRAEDEPLAHRRADGKPLSPSPKERAGPTENGDSDAWSAARDASWCAGAGGVLAASFSMGGICRTVGVSDVFDGWWKRALDKLVEARYVKDATLCCGAAGRLDLLLEAAARIGADHSTFSDRTVDRRDVAILHSPRIRSCSLQDLASSGDRSNGGLELSRVDEAVSAATRDLLERSVASISNFRQDRPAIARGLPGMLSQPDVCRFSAGLYTGLSGVGYALLRAAAPATIPCLLTWNLDPDTV